MGVNTRALYVYTHVHCTSCNIYTCAVLQHVSIISKWDSVGEWTPLFGFIALYSRSWIQLLTAPGVRGAFLQARNSVVAF